MGLHEIEHELEHLKLGQVPTSLVDQTTVKNNVNNHPSLLQKTNIGLYTKPIVDYLLAPEEVLGTNFRIVPQDGRQEIICVHKHVYS